MKALALAWAAAQGWTFAAAEVRVPRSGFRADVVAAAPDLDGMVAVFECKQSRIDLRKDAHAEELVGARIAALEERQRTIERLWAVHHPERRRGEAFWAEFDAWDFPPAEHRAYRGVLRQLATLRRRRREGTKFSRMLRYRCADRLYLVCEEEIFAPADIPGGWGLLVRQGDELVLRAEPAAIAVSPAQRQAIRQAIGRKCLGPHPLNCDELLPCDGRLQFADSA